MTAKSQKRQVVEFCAASPRLILAYHHAAQRSKYLTRLADFRDLRQAVGIHDLGKNSRKFQRVVLSHADDDYRSLIDARAETLVSGAFHLLFTGPTTHPDQVAQWMRLTNIRSENRLHVVIDPDGSFIYWPDLDVHLGWNQFLQAVDPAEFRKAQQRSAEFNARYGAAIRRVREAAGIVQSGVEGLTERQVRRIEYGESRARRSDRCAGRSSRSRCKRLHGEAGEGAEVIGLQGEFSLCMSSARFLHLDQLPLEAVGIC